MSRDDDYLSLEEHYFSNDRKNARKERKFVSRKDRSQFKKTDRDQRKKLEDEQQTENTLLSRGRVLSITPDGILVDCESQAFLCTLKGALKKQNHRMKNLIAVGDIVLFEKGQGCTGAIVKVTDRTSILSRADNLSRNKEQLIAVNIDQVIITCSVFAPPLKPSLVDRYIIAAKKGCMEPIIVINKIDQLNLSENDVSAVDKEKKLLEEFINTYRALSLTVILVSAETGEGIKDLKKTMMGKTSVFSGQSGVGKSRLINLITGGELPIGDIVKKTLKGSHTTTTTSLIPLDNDSFCIDTPGIKSFGLWDLKSADIKKYFSEILIQSEACKFPDCLHLQEPHCNVKKAVEEGKISLLRFDSYCALMAGFEEKHGRR